MKIYSVDFTESRENKQKSSSKILLQAGLNLWTSDFQVLLSGTEPAQNVLSATGLQWDFM